MLQIFMKVRKNCICVANFAQSKPSASPGSQNFAFPKIKEKEKIHQSSALAQSTDLEDPT
jgi:hypothetical protein